MIPWDKADLLIMIAFYLGWWVTTRTGLRTDDKDVAETPPQTP